MVPSILGFDPRYQFIHEDDIVAVLEHAVREELPGIYNAAGDGVLVLSEVASLLGKPLAPVLPPWGTGPGPRGAEAARAQHPARDGQPDALRARARQPQAEGSGSVAAPHHARDGAGVAEHLRVAAIKRDAGEPYRYEREVEEFLRYSPSVRKSSDAPAKLQG